MIKITNLNKYYNKNKSNEIHVIDNTSLELPNTGLITFLGHSGSGKTTLLNVVGGLDKATGQIDYDGVSFNKYSVSKIDKFRSRNIGYVFQNYNLLLNETVYDNLRIALDLIGVSNLEEQKKRIEYTLKSVGMFKFRKKLASNLSGGQQQRVSIARALVKKSKIIIADEPTGNLDSKNSIEVMNILKKISEKALVLLVTHEENLANFYSDIIFELKDGKIINSKENVSSELFEDEESSNSIYLKDLEKKEEKTEIGNITVYSDNSKELKADISFIIKNGTIYLKSSESIKLVDSRINIIDDHYKPIDKKKIEGFDYDTSWYNDTKEDKKTFKKFITRLKNSLISFRSVGKKQKLIYVCLTFIGFIMAIAFASLANGTMVDLGSTNYSKKVNVVDVPSNKSTINILNSAYDSGEIDNVIPLAARSLKYTENVLYNYGVSVNEYTSVLPIDIVKPDLRFGNLPQKDDEIVVSDSFVNVIKKKTNRTDQEVLGLQVEMTLDYTYGYYKICGISKDDNMMAYITSDAYDMIRIYPSSYYSFVIDNYPFTMDRYIRNKAKEEYTIISGRDIQNAFEILANKDHKLGEQIYVGVDIYEVVGIYDSKYADSSSYIIDQAFSVKDERCQAVSVESSLVTILEGKYPTSKQEVLANKYAGKAIGDTVKIDYKNYTVVGIYDGSVSLGYSYITNRSNRTFEDYYHYYSNYTFTVKKADAFNNRLKDYNAKLVNYYQYAESQRLDAQQQILKGFIIVFASCVVASSLFVYFVMRSKMLSDIYSIGVYRSLGASRFRINRKYISDILVLTTFTCLIGYVIGVLGYYWFSYMINSVVYELLNSKAIMFSWIYSVLGGLSLYAVMLIFGLLPIIMLQRKTPSEICSKYDI